MARALVRFAIEKLDRAVADCCRALKVRNRA
jgi:hypothetical protein